MSDSVTITIPATIDAAITPNNMPVQKPRNGAEFGILRATKYRNAPGRIGVPRGLAQSVRSTQCKTILPPFDNALPRRFVSHASHAARRFGHTATTWIVGSGDSVLPHAAGRYGAWLARLLKN